MRKTAIDENSSGMTRLPASLRERAKQLTRTLNNAEKPRSFPQTAEGRPCHISQGVAINLAVALMLDLIDEGVRPADLMEQFGVLDEVDPRSAEDQRWDLIAKKVIGG